MRRRIASPRNVPNASSVASPSMLPLPHWPPAGPQLLFHFINQCLLMLALWSCGRRASVVQAQRQIHRVLGKAGIIKPSRYPSCRSTDRTSTAEGCRPPPRPWRMRHACRSAAVITTAPLRVLDMRACHCKSLRNDSQAAVPAQAGIIRLRNRALPRRSQSQAPSLGLRRPVAAQLLAATL